MKKIIIIGLLLLSLSSCQRIFYGGSFSPDYNLLSHPDIYKITDKAQGSATATYFIGIGGFKHEKLLNDAKADLIANAHLKSGQYLSNYVIEQNSSNYLFIITKTKYIVTADIVELKSNNANLTPEKSSTIQQAKTTPKADIQESFTEVKKTVSSLNDNKPLITTSSKNDPEFNIRLLKSAKEFYDKFRSDTTAIRDSISLINSDIHKLKPNALKLYDDYSTILFSGKLDNSNLPKGLGIMVNNQSLFEGTFMAGNLENGKVKLETGDKEFWGCYVNGKRNGIGWDKTISNGSFKLGVFEEGNFVRGIIYEKSKTSGPTISYFGNYKDKERTGYGEAENQKEFGVGQFENGKLIDGYIRQVDPSGSKTFYRIDGGNKFDVNAETATSFFNQLDALKGVR